MRFGAWVDAIRLEHCHRIGPIRNAFKKKRHHRRLVLFCHGGKNTGKPARVVAAIVGRHLHPHQEHLGACLLCGLCHPGQVVFSAFQCQPAQRIVAPQFNHYQRGSVLGQQGNQARSSTRRGFAAHAGIDDAGGQLFSGQAFFQ